MIGEAIHAHLTQVPEILALVQDRVVPVLDIDSYRGESVIVYDVADSEQIARSLDNPGNLRSYNVTLTCIAPMYASATALAALVRSHVDDQSGTWGDMTVQGAFFEDENDDKLPVTEDGKTTVCAIQQTYTIIVAV